MRFSVISSGSSANCTYIESQGSSILIDCGLSARKTCERLSALGIKPQAIQAIIVTHEHCDHISGISVFSRQNKIPVYATKPVEKFLRKIHAFEEIKSGQEFSIGKLNIQPFSIPHDAQDPVGFIVKSAGLKFAQATDLGKVTHLVEQAVADAHALVLESNHDLDMLYACSYPWDLKQRIASNYGHLSNLAAAELASNVIHSDLNHLVLGHISENSNTPKIALENMQKSLAVHQNYKPNILCAERHAATQLFEVGQVIRPEVISIERAA